MDFHRTTKVIHEDLEIRNMTNITHQTKQPMPKCDRQKYFAIIFLTRPRQATRLFNRNSCSRISYSPIDTGASFAFLQVTGSRFYEGNINAVINQNSRAY